MEVLLPHKNELVLLFVQFLQLDDSVKITSSSIEIRVCSRRSSLDPFFRELKGPWPLQIIY